LGPSEAHLADQVAQVVASGKTLYATRAERLAEYLNYELTGLADAGYGRKTK
jgi:hypothetical protein